jgi:hypothetical protein
VRDTHARASSCAYGAIPELNRIPIQFGSSGLHPRPSVSICGENIFTRQLSLESGLLRNWKSDNHSIGIGKIELLQFFEGDPSNFFMISQFKIP